MKEIKSGIYKIINLTNSKIYIGSAKDVAIRWRNHKRELLNNKHHNRYLQRSWNKYEEGNFQFEVVEYVGDVELLIEREQYYIDLFHACNRKYGYNINPVAGSCLGRVHTQETKQKIREKHIGKKMSEESRLKMRFAKLGVSPSEKQRLIASQTWRGRKHTEESILKMKQKHKGKIISEDTKNKLRLANLGKKTKEDVKERISLGLRGKNNKLTENDVLLIKILLGNGETGSKISKMFNINQSTISQIKLGKTWSYINPAQYSTEYIKAIKSKKDKRNGLNAANSKFNKEEILKIRQLLKIYKINEIAKLYAVDRRTISRIKKQKTYTDVS